MENTIGKRIAALRREKDLKQEDIARALDVSSQAVSKWENGKTFKRQNSSPCATMLH